MTDSHHPTPEVQRSRPSRVLVVIPTYNEIESLPIIIDGLAEARPEVDILVVDDSSPDGTGHLADRIAAGHPGVHTLHRTEKDGLGGAYLAGFAWGLARHYEVLVEMDADGSHRPSDLRRLLAAIDDGADFVIGSRWVRGGAVVNWPLRRRALSVGGNHYARLLLGTPLRDLTGGFRAVRAGTLRAVDLSRIGSSGYCFQVDLAWRAIRSGAEVREVPITFVERAFGESKMSGGIILEALARVTGWALAHRIQQARRLVGGEQAVA